MIMMGNKRKMAALILGPRSKEEPGPEAESSLKAISQELIDCVHAGDAAGVESALRAAFAELDAEPHAEGPHVEEE